MCNFLKNVTIEPVLLFFIMVQEWMVDLDSNLFLQKACRFNHTSEPDLNTKCDDEKRGILFVSAFNSSYGFWVKLLNILILIFASIWSDEAGRRRRPFIFLAILGLVLNSLSGCLNSYFWHWIPSAAIVSSAAIHGFSADGSLMIPFAQMYLCDISNVENRTMRLGIAAAIRMFATVLGKGGSGFILRRIGFVYFYALCFLLSVISLACGFIFIKDTSLPVEKKIRFYQMFSWRRLLLVDSFKVVFDRKLGKKRIIVLLLIFVYTANAFTFKGEISLLYLYLRHRFKFDERMYSKYVLCKYLLACLGALFCSFVLSKRLKIHDGVIGILASFWDTLACLAMLFGTKVWHLFASTFLDMFHNVVILISVSFMSKYYNSNELGRLNAVNTVFLLAIPLAFPAYNKIFQKTLDTFPSAYFLLSMVLNIVVFSFFVASYFLCRKFTEKEPIAKEEEFMIVSKDIATPINSG